MVGPDSEYVYIVDPLAPSLIDESKNASPVFSRIPILSALIPDLGNQIFTEVGALHPETVCSALIGPSAGA
jgi:hypothetical protein